MILYEQHLSSHISNTMYCPPVLILKAGCKGTDFYLEGRMGVGIPTKVFKVRKITKSSQVVQCCS